MPERPGKMCAVGYSGPTFYQQDCVGNAADNARGHLSENISATIRTVTIDISDGTRGMFSRDVFVQGSETVSNSVLKGSEIEAQWVELQGQRGGPKGCYAFVCIDPKKPIDSFVEELQDKKVAPKTVQKVRENAEAAFDELEKLEQAKEQQEAAPQPKAETPKVDEEKSPAAEEQPKIYEEKAPADDAVQPKTDEEKAPAGDEPTEAVRKIEIPPTDSAGE